MKYPLSFKAAILEKNNAPLAIHTVTFDGPLHPGHVLVRVHASGICGKQIEEITGTMGPDKFLPHMLGHEGSGEVVDIGSAVTKVKVGDHVVLHWLKGSGIDAPTPHYHRKGIRVNAGWLTTFNEYAVVSENRVTPIPKGADLSTACLLGCAVMTGVGVILNEARPRPNEPIAIVGCGGVGLMAVQAAAISYAHPIIAADVNKKSLELAKSLGATHIYDSTSIAPNDILRIIPGGFTYVIVTTGNPEGIEFGIRIARMPSTVYFVGVPPKDAKITIHALDVHRKKTLTGSTGGGCIPERDIPTYLSLFHKGLIKLAESTYTVPLSDINKGISMMRSGTPGRCIVMMTSG